MSEPPRPAQAQSLPGHTAAMQPAPRVEVPMQHAADPDEVAPSYVFFAADRLSGYYTGEVLAPVGGETLPG